MLDCPMAPKVRWAPRVGRIGGGGEFALNPIRLLHRRQSFVCSERKLETKSHSERARKHEAGGECLNARKGRLT